MARPYHIYQINREMMTKDIIIYNYVYPEILECCKHAHEEVMQPARLNSVVMEFLGDPGDMAIAEKIEVTLCQWSREKDKGILDVGVVRELVGNVLKVRKTRSILLTLFLLAINYNSIQIIKQLKQNTEDANLRIVFQYWIQNQSRNAINSSLTQQLDQLCLFLSEISASTNKIVDLCIRFLLRNCLFKCLLAIEGLNCSQQSIEEVKAVEITAPYLKCKDSLEKVLQNIYLIAIESQETHRSLMQWLGQCISNHCLKQILSKGNYLLIELCRVLLKIEQLFHNSDSVRLLIKDTRTLPPNSPLAQSIIKQILSVNNKKILQQHILQLIDFDIVNLYPLMYSKFFPYALKWMDKIKQNIMLVNCIAKIKFQIDEDWNVVIKNEVFMKFFKHICHYLTSDNLCLFYRKFNEDLFRILIEPNRKTFQSERAFLHYLLLDRMFDAAEPGMFEIATRIVTIFYRRKDNDSENDLYEKYYRRCWDCFVTIQNPSVQIVIRMIALESTFEKEEMSHEIQVLIKQIDKQAWAKTEEKELAFILSVFIEQPNKSLALALLRYSFYHLISSPSNTQPVIKTLTLFQKKLDEYQYYLLHCYSEEIFDELLIIYSTEGVNEELLSIVQSLILKWINFAHLRQIHHIYEIGKYESSSEFLKKRIKLLRDIDESKKCKVFQSMDNRLCGFLKLFHRIMSYQQLIKSHQDETKCIIYNNQKNLISLTYKFYQQQFDSPFEVLITLQNNPQYPQPCVFYIRQPNLQHKFLLSKNQISLIKISKQDSKVIAEKSISDVSTLIIKLEVDLEKENTVVHINKEQFEFIVFRNSQKEGVGTRTLQTIEIGLETSDSYLQSVDIVYNTVKKLSFNMNTSNQTQKRFTLNINQLNCLKMFNSLEYLSLKYLFVFILQIASNELSYSLHAIDSIFPLIYRIVFHQIEYSPKTEFFGLFTLEYVTKTIIELASTVCFNDIKSNTIRLMMKPNRMGLEFFKQIILNFEIWSNCSFAAQSIILDIIMTVLQQSPLALKLIVDDIVCFHEISDFTPKYYSALSPSKNLKAEEKDILKSRVQEIIFKIITSSNTELFQKYISYMLKSILQQNETSKIGRKSQVIKKSAAELVEKIVEYYLPTSLNSELKEKFFIIIVKIREFRIIVENVSVETADSLLQYMFKICRYKEVPSEIYGNLKIILNSLSLISIEKQFPEVLEFLEGSNKSKSQEKLITNILTPYLLRYQSLTVEIKSKILSYLITLYQGNRNIQEKSNVFTIKLLSTLEFVEMLVNLSDDDLVDPELRSQTKTFLDICWESVHHMPKQLFFDFLYLFRRRAGNKVNVLSAPILNFDVSKSTIVDCSLMVQYAYESLLVYQSSKQEKNQFFLSSILHLIQDITSRKYDQLYCTDPQISKNIEIDRNKIMDMTKRSFEIKGGVLYKLILLLFEYLKLTQEIKIVEKIRDILIFNVDKSEDLRTFRKSRNSTLFNLGSQKNITLGSTNEFELLTKRTTKAITQKYPEINEEVGYNMSSEKQSKQPTSWAFLEFVVLKLSLFEQHCTSTKTKIEVHALINELSQRYPHLQSQYHPDNISPAHEFQYCQFIKSFTEDVVDFIKSQPKLIDAYSPIRRTTSYRYETITPIKRKYSTAPKLTSENIKYIKENAPEKAYKLLKLEFGYTYLIKSNISSTDDPALNEEENQKMLREFKKYVQKQNQIKSTNKNQMNIYWKQFLEKAEGENGFLHEIVHKKKPILKLRAIHLPNMVRGVTKEISDYDYQLMKQTTLSLNQKQSFLSFSFLKPKSFVSPDEKKSIVEVFPPIIEEIEGSGSIKIDSEWVTRRGVYFSRFNLDISNQRITVQADVNGRPEKPQYIFGSTKDSIIKGKSKTLQIKFEEIKEIFLRRYNQIQDNAIEVFTHNSHSYLFVFYSRKVVIKILNRLKGSPILKQEQFITNCQQTFRQRKYTEKWQNGKISNFDYLMVINIFSGRTFNDPNQYPIFPWVIEDYRSSELDLHNPKIYRDLYLPIGALNQEKLERYMQNSKIHDEEEEYLYGSFLSTSMFVFYYLVRIEPFSSLARELQGGHFDSPDRLFNSMADIWRSITCESNTSDVKELIPQFYNVNVFLQNRNRLDFGKTQTGVTIDDVILPPWASNSNIFISIMKEALESDFVSMKLHYWIDLIFGNHQYSKQRFNMFHPRYYEKNINFSDVEPHQIEALIAQITYFGQFPKKMFAKDHPPRTQFIKRPLKFRQIYKQELVWGYVEKIKKSTDSFTISIHENKSSKTYTIRTPFENNIKRVEIEKSSAYKTGELLLVESKDYAIHYKNTFESMFLKKFSTNISFKKSVVSNRYVVLCGKDLTVLNFQGKAILTLSNIEPKAAIILDNILVFLDKKFNLKRLNILHPEKMETIYTEEPKYCHCQLLGYRIGSMEGYLLCFNRAILVYIAN